MFLMTKDIEAFTKALEEDLVKKEVERHGNSGMLLGVHVRPVGEDHPR